MKDSTETDTKIEIEEAAINFICVKEEITNVEENKDVKGYGITPQRIFLGETSCMRNIEEYGNSLISSPDTHCVIENTLIKLEDIKEENFDNFHCSKCNGNYEGYCVKCSTLSWILNKNESFANLEPGFNITPRGILEIRYSSVGKCVFLLRTLPKNVIFGPFDGISGIKAAERHRWKIQNKKLVNIENGNWMKNVVCARNTLSKNLDIFQFDGNLYFQTNREIMEGEELLVYYDDEEIQTTSDSEECYFIPHERKKLPKIFACTLCCLGFSLKNCLTEHKSKCLCSEHDRNITDSEVIECDYCKIWLQKQEYETSHMTYCCEKYQRIWKDHPQSSGNSEIYVEETKEAETDFKIEFVDMNELSERGNLQIYCVKDDYTTDNQYEMCSRTYDREDNLPIHIEDEHMDETVDASIKEQVINKYIQNGKHKCTQCPYQTNRKNNLQTHLDAHNGIKAFQCAICRLKFARKGDVKRHIDNIHAAPGTAKDYQCSVNKCFYQTNRKWALKVHSDSHAGIKPVQCDICMTKFTQKSSLTVHMKNIHSTTDTEKYYKCSKCPYETSSKSYLQDHVDSHADDKPFECDVCPKKFTLKYNLIKHIKVKHTAIEKDFKCSECNFRTDYKTALHWHLNTHRDIKPFQCNICMKKFSVKCNLETHMTNNHTLNGNAKNYKCSECFYETDCKTDLKSHFNTHNGFLPFECFSCNMKFARKLHLNVHIQNIHVADLKNKFVKLETLKEEK